MAAKPNLRREKFSAAREKNGTPIKRGDARLKIIQKNRSKLVDARDRLAQMAQKTDARSKILKIRQHRAGVNTANAESVRPVGSSILMKTDRNGKISLSTNKNKKSPLRADIHEAIRKELGLGMQRKPQPPKRHMVRNLPRSQAQSGYKNIPMRSLNISVDGYSRDLNMTTAYTPPIIKRTIRNDAMREIPVMSDYPHPRSADPTLYTWVRPPPRHSMPKTVTPFMALHESMMRPSIEVTARNNLAMEPSPLDDWTYANPGLRSFKMFAPVDDDMDDVIMEEPMPHLSTVAQRLKTGVHARLDTPAVSQHSQGIFAHTKTKVVVPVGHRIVVSNLQSTVTQDDIRELFEDIGELLVSRLVRPGTAEVIYKNLKDAQKAVDTYHNRQLDGQPMKCLLVNKRPVNNPTAPAVRTTKTTQSVLRTSSGITKKIATNAKLSNKLVPDISTIHKVLFHKT